MAVKRTISFFLMLSGSLLMAQEVYVGSSASMFVGTKSSVFSGGDLRMGGALDNQGTLFLNAHVDFASNTAVGDLVFMGGTDQYLRGNTLQARSVTLQSLGKVNLQATQLLSSQLHLESGILHAPEPGSLVILEGQSVSGGSLSSHVTGSLQLQSLSNASLRFPLGLNGNYNELTLKRSIPGSMVEVTAQMPEAALIPGDSLVGISEEILWVIQQSGEEFDSEVAIAFEGVDLENVPTYNEIRASSYRPVVAHKTHEASVFTPLGLAENDDSGERSAGRLTSARSVSINGNPIHLAIGLMPEGGPYLYIPNAFTPGGIYQENRVFRPFLDGAGVYSLEMTIWDQYNGEVYAVQSANADLDQIGWDGTINGQEAPEAIYYYRISMETAVGSFSENGTVVLLR